jgi:hypothetical protein
MAFPGQIVGMVGSPGRLILLASVVVVLAGTIMARWRYELRPSTTQQAAAATPQRPDPRARSPKEERYAAARWKIQRQVTLSAVAMSFAGIAYEADNHAAHLLERKIEPVVKLFGEAEPRVRGLTVPPSLSKVHGQYLEAIILYRKAGDEMLAAFTKDGERRHLVDAEGMSVTASEDILRAGEVLWPGQYKPH